MEKQNSCFKEEIIEERNKSFRFTSYIVNYKYFCSLIKRQIKSLKVKFIIASIKKTNKVSEKNFMYISTLLY